MRLVRQDVMDFDLSCAVERLRHKNGQPVDWAVAGFLFSVGNHYKLCGYLAHQLHYATILDVGTAEGASAIALAARAGEGTQVISLDIIDKLIFKTEELPVERRIMNVLTKDADPLIMSSKLIFLDIDPHDGEQEWRFLDKLMGLGFKGVLVLDDIHLEPTNRCPHRRMNDFWSAIPFGRELRKYDLTHFCHNTEWNSDCPVGTGLIDCGNHLDEIDIW